MPNPVTLHFLGTGGGRFATITQKRRTAGIRIITEDAKTNIHLDPGPGALIYSINAGLDPQKINAIIISHSHPDHYTDAEVLVEAMTRGTIQKRGTLAAANSVLNGNTTCEASISKYHQKMPQQTITTTPNTVFQINQMTITTTKAQHTDPDAVGYRFKTAEFGEFAYTSDTEYYANIGEQYKNARLLILCVMRPGGKPWTGHMTTDDAIKIIKETKPEIAVITHFGMRMILEGPTKEAKRITQECGIPVIAAVDGMRVVFGEQIRTEKPIGKRQADLNMFLKR
ncbi:MAG: MBL fold metallo-hydrolase [Candidatus Bathyarchaeia archaeon]|jgi:phosphoribosyl 1,2-cyclic phosphodiesterase|nr:MBL fold metallo-hydrolase [Candidatus Bathyarchaeota archaeon A05DMB-4]MDH7594765.1 MBL fold metallo-hydrolase [Candidatus Bathyarchaeota archaeon]